MWVNVPLPVMFRFSLHIAALVVLLGSPAAAQAQRKGVPTPAKRTPAPAEEPEAPPTTTVGSFGPDVYLDDITYTLRLNWFRSVAVDETNPDVAYVGSYDGYVFKTMDGGKTWDESRLIPERRPFYGDAGERVYFGRHRFNVDLGNPIGSDTPDKALGPRRKDPFAFLKVGSGGGGGGSATGANANVNFGIGLPGGAPRLQLLVRKFGKPTSGLNLNQMLLLRGVLPLEVRIIVIHPHNPKIVFACTMSGLFKSYDGGLNWVRTFMGTSPKGWMTFHVAVDPSDGQKVFLATGEGLYVSTDGGENFSRSTKKGVGEGVIDWIYFNPFDSRYVFVGTDYGLLRSKDGGDDWEWIYFTTFPDGRVVRSVALDPFDRKTGYIATHDGLYVTDDMLHGGLESWRRLGGLKFTGVQTAKIAACPKHKGHLWTLTNMQLFMPTVPGKSDTGGAFVYESVDGGKNWKVIYSGLNYGSMQWFESDPRDPDLLWLIWSRAMQRMKRRDPNEPPTGTPVILDDPPISEVLLAALRYTGVEPSRMLEYRWRSRIKALVPTIAAQFRYHRWNDLALLQDGLYPTLPYRQDSGWLVPHREFRLLFTWDLSDLVFNLNTVLFGRVDRLGGEFRGWLVHQIHRFYGELRRLRALMRNKPPRELRVRLIYRLRMEELTSLVNFITGDYLTRWYQGGDHPRGMDTKWWEPWPVRRQ